MIDMLNAIAQSPSRGFLIWDADCPNLRRTSISPQAEIITLDTEKFGRDIVLVLPPVSGHSSALIQDLAKPICDDYDARVLHWHDPAFLPAHEADYGHGTQIAITRNAIQHCLSHLSGNSKLHIMAICQSSSPTLIALDGLKSSKVTLTFIAAPLVETPGGVCDLFSDPERGQETLRQIKFLTTPGLHGVPMLAGGTQLAAILNGSGGALRLLQSAITHENMQFFYASARTSTMRRMSLLDARSIPERLLIEGLSSNFIERNHLTSKIDTRIPIHLLAGDSDEVVPYNQTFLIKEHLRTNHISKTLFSDLDHFDLFSSSTARHTVSFEIKEFFKSPVNRRLDTTV
jgi:hypothetical protein